jgi:hypothetical protein
MFSLCFFPSLSLAGARAIYHSKHVWHFNNALNMKRGRNKNGFVFCTDEQPDRDRDEAGAHAERLQRHVPAGRVYA